MDQLDSKKDTQAGFTPIGNWKIEELELARKENLGKVIGGTKSEKPSHHLIEGLEWRLKASAFQRVS